ncbi:MAG: type II secretion system secretin GspD [Thioalkalivibrionaceae bacterium]
MSFLTNLRAPKPRSDARFRGSVTRSTRVAIIAIAIALASGCAAVPDRDSGSPFDRGFNLAGFSTPERGVDDPRALSDVRLDRRPYVIFRGDDRVLGTPERRAQDPDEDTVTLDFEQAPLQEVVHVLLGEILEANYTIERPLEGQVSLRTNRPVAVSIIPDLLDSLLRANGAAIQRTSSGDFRVRPLELASESPGLGDRRRLSPGLSTVVMPLRHIGASEMAEILMPLAPEGAILRVDVARNVLLMRGSREQIEGWNEIVDTFDVDALAGMSVGLFPLEFAPASEVYRSIRTLLGQGGGVLDNGGESAVVDAADLGGARIIPIERLNSLLVVSTSAARIERIRTWIDRFDRPIESGFEPQLRVYDVQNGSAIHLANLLASVYGGGVAASRDSSAGSGVAPGLQERRVGTTGGGTGSASSGAGGGASAPDAAALGSSSTELRLDERGRTIRVVADEINNALLIYASANDYRRIEEALRQLDRSPTQVLIEANIIEVTLRDGLEFGLEWSLNNAIGSGFRGLGRLNSTQSGGIGARSPGFSYSIVNPADELRAVFNALANDSLLRVLSNPTVLVLDNHIASIRVGDQQPVRTGRTITEGGVVTDSIEFKDTGILLEVRPSVNAGGLVTMGVVQTVTDVGALDDATGQRTFLQREIRSRVAVRSGESVVLGGLIRENRSDDRSGIPGLRNAPVVSPLFGRTSVDNTRTELLVVITPRVLGNEAELRAISGELRGRLRNIDRKPRSLLNLEPLQRSQAIADDEPEVER